MTSGTSDQQTQAAIPMDGQGRLTTSIGIAILAVSAAGLVHGALGLPWTIGVQAGYAAVAGLVAWRRMR